MMTTLSELFPKETVKSIQTGYINTTASSGSAEDEKYYDVTISAVTVANCFCEFVGSSASTTATTRNYEKGTDPYQSIPTIRLTSTTNLRITGKGAAIGGRWTVTEYK